MQCLLMEHYRDAQACIFYHPLLDGICEFSRLPWASHTAGSGYLAYAAPEYLGSVFRKKFSLFVNKGFTCSGIKTQHLHGTGQLGEFCLKGNAKKKARSLFIQPGHRIP